MNNWYTTTKENDLQGLICDEATGKNIAVSYDPKDAALIAATPELLEALKAIVARINGEWDNPALLKMGLLHADATKDILRIAEDAIATIEEQSK